MNPLPMSPLAKKVRFENAQHALLLNAPKGFREGLGAAPEGTQIDTQVSVDKVSSGQRFRPTETFCT